MNLQLLLSSLTCKANPDAADMSYHCAGNPRDANVISRGLGFRGYLWGQGFGLSL